MVKVILVLFLLALASCKQDSAPNYLFLVIENFNSKTVYCDPEENLKLRSGLKIICEDFNKFTHVYTTSIQSLPALTSLFTGLYPYSHNVRANTENYLAPEFKSFIELAKTNYNYKTHFLSAGAPFFRKSGLHQGFEVFDDHISSDKDMRSLKENLELYFEILKEDKNDRLLSVIHISDLKYPFKETHNEFGESRNLTMESQLEEIDEKLYYLFNKLKTEKLWENTRILIIGLNGLPNSEFNLEPAPMSLKSDNTQVGFYFKDIKKKTLNSKPLTINTALSIKDIGQFLIHNFSKTKNNNSLIDLLNQDKMDQYKFSNPEKIIIETTWDRTNFQGQIRSALIDESYLFIFDKKNKIYNKLSDSNELYPQPINHQLIAKVNSYKEYLTQKNFIAFQESKSVFLFQSELDAINKNEFSSKNGSEFYDFFVLLNAIEKKDIYKVESLISKYPILSADPCLKYFPKPGPIDRVKKECKNPVSQLFLESLNPLKNNDKEIKVFVQNEINNFMIIKNAYKKNLKLNLDYFSINEFKIELLKPYLLMTLIPN